MPVAQEALDYLQLDPGDFLLEAGCGTGGVVLEAYRRNIRVVAFDPSLGMRLVAQQRAPMVPIHDCSLDNNLPFKPHLFNGILAVNALQFAADATNALKRLKRALRRDGRIAIVVWGPPALCQAPRVMKVLNELAGPPPPGAKNPFSLSEIGAVAKAAKPVGLEVLFSQLLPCNFVYPSVEVAIDGFLSAGPAMRAVEIAGEELARLTLRRALGPFINQRAAVVLENYMSLTVLVNA
jgi:SAM-dependent methyltransferase